MNITSPKSARGVLALVLAISVALHLAVVFVFGVIKIAGVVFREEVTFEAPPIDQPPQQEVEYNVNLTQRNRSSSPPPPNPIVVSNPQDVDIPAVDINVNVAGTSAYGRGGGGFGGGTSGTAQIREMAITAELFGIEVTAEKLGVVLDVSFSTHKNIHRVIEEISSEFRDAIIVFIPGCAVGNREGEVFPLREYDDAVEKYPLPDDARGYTTQFFVDALIEKNTAFDRIWGRLRNQDRGFVVFCDINVRNRTDDDGNTEVRAEALGGVKEAMEFLADEGVDVIYWFADYQDGVDGPVADDVAGDLRRRRIQLIMHDFVAPLGGDQDNDRAKRNFDFLQGMADETEGKFFLNEDLD